jgi:hypothetical protein
VISGSNHACSMDGSLWCFLCNNLTVLKVLINCL